MQTVKISLRGLCLVLLLSLAVLLSPSLRTMALLVSSLSTSFRAALHHPLHAVMQLVSFLVAVQR